MTIKFRGKRKDTGDWIYGDMCNDINGGISIMPKPFYGSVIFTDEDELKYDVKKEGLSLGGWFSVFPETVGQFIGLTDKSGKEIHTGDMVRTVRGDWGVIVYKAPFFEVTVSADQSSMYSREWFENVEVIGNIYENPEKTLYDCNNCKGFGCSTCDDKGFYYM